jgi:hypothetical protein
MQYTLLELTQSILSSLSSDEVNSIGDTTESQQIANIIETVYYNMAARSELPEHEGLIQLVGMDDTLRPVMMSVPAGTSKISWIQYYDTNPSDGTSIQTDQYGAYSVHDVNTDLQNNSTFQASYPWTATSTSSITVGLGIKSFTVAPNLTIGLGNQVEILSGTTTYMSGVVTAYNNSVVPVTNPPTPATATLVINVTATSGSGTYTTWTLNQINAPTTAPGYKRVRVMSPHEFILKTSTFNTQESDVQTYNFIDQGNSFVMAYKNSVSPRHCCFISNQYILFDSFDASQDSTLQGNKTLCWGWFIPPFQLQDNFIPLLSDYQFPLLLAEAKSLAFFELKQMTHPKAEQEAKRQWSNLQKNKSVTNKPSYFHQLPDFGRRLWTGGYASGFPYDYTQGYRGS